MIKRIVTTAVALSAMAALPLTYTQSAPTQLTASTTPSMSGSVVAVSATSANGLLFASTEGNVASNGNATTHGQPSSVPTPVVGMAALPSGTGYYLATQSGNIYNFGSAPNHGDTYTYGITGLTGSKPLNAPIVGMATTPHGHGYWLVAADGGVFNFGSAGFYGSTYTYGITGLSGKRPLNAPIVAMVPTPNGKGYWLVAKDGGVFDFGDAKFYGSTYTYGITGLSGKRPLNAPIVGAAATPSGGGYYLVASDGGVFDFGNAKFGGSAYSKGYTGLAGTHPLPSPVAGLAPDPTANGYWMVTQTGKVLNFGAAASMPGVSAKPYVNPAALTDPSSNISPVASNNACDNANYVTNQPNTPGCITVGLGAINQGNASEGLAPMVLPSNFDSLTRAEQLFVLVNEARIERGLTPIYGIASDLQSSALSAAQQLSDPNPQSLPPGAQGSWESDWADGPSTTDNFFAWMYDDGPGQYDFNIACPSSGGGGCWGHRKSIIYPYNSYYSKLMGSPYVTVMGVASVNMPQVPIFESDTLLFVPVAQSSLGQIQFVYTWAQAVASGA
jgi:ribosomal protein L24E